MNRIAKFFSFLGIFLLILSVLIIFAAIISRYFLGIGLPWPEELTRFLYLWFTFCGIVVAEYKNSHLRVDVLLSYVGSRSRKVISFLALLITLGFYAVAAYWGYDMTMFNHEMETVAVSMDIELVWIWAALPVCLAAAALMAACNIFKMFSAKQA